ncbi:FecR domain-containing protein [Rhodospirillum sp. A1_3_36]|uniref:FecR family protein n=1 Tax=Rhodospirillum sp. A1_3_36 TaxID=3391666 RepID=UPI0039A4274A
MIVRLGFTVMCWFIVASVSWASSPIGQVKTASGDVWVLHEGRPQLVGMGAWVYEQDTLTTSHGSSLGVTFIDNSTLSLGASSRLTVDEFSYDPVEDEQGLSLSLFAGLLAYVSGDIVKSHPENASIVTPAATIGIRGTRFVVRVGDSQ